MLLKSLCFILMDYLSWQSYLHYLSHYRHRKILILIHAKDQKIALQIHYLLHHKFIATALAHFVGMAFCFVTSKCLLPSVELFPSIQFARSVYCEPEKSQPDLLCCFAICILYASRSAAIYSVHFVGQINRILQSQ